MTEFLGAQFGNPRGTAGKLCCLLMNAMNQSLYRSVVHSVSLPAKARLLDIGFGNGYLLQRLAKACDASLYGVDPSLDSKRLAEKRNQKGVAAGRVRLFVGDCGRLDFENGFFDAVTTVNTIYFWGDTKKGFSEIYRVLKPGGSFYNAMYTKAWLGRLPHTKKGFQLFEPEELISFGKQAGFSRVICQDIAKGKSLLVQFVKESSLG